MKVPSQRLFVSVRSDRKERPSETEAGERMSGQYTLTGSQGTVIYEPSEKRLYKNMPTGESTREIL
jgi:hypothetical protein